MQYRCDTQVRYYNLQRNISAWFVKFVCLALRPFIKPADVHHYLAFSIQFDVSAIHRPRRRSFEVDSFAVVATAMAGTLEFVFTGFPVGRAAEVRAARINHKHAIGSFVNPDSILLLPLGIDAKCVIRRKANRKLGGSRIERGRKNRRNIRKQVVRKPTMLAQTILRRILLTGGSGVLSTTAPAGFGVSSQPRATDVSQGGDRRRSRGHSFARIRSHWRCWRVALVERSIH